MAATALQGTRRVVRTIRSLVGAAAVVGLAFAFAPTASAESPNLTLFEWAGYDDVEFHKAYAEKYNGSPQYSFFADEEEAFNKLRAGFKADLMHPCIQSIPKWRDAGLLKPIDVSRLPKWADIYERFRNLPHVMTSDGKAWFVPFDWGNSGMTYITGKLTEEQASTLQTFIDPAMAGKVSIPDNVDDAYALAFLATGIKDWTNVTDAQFQAASDWLRKAHPNVRFYWGDPNSLNQGMANGEVDLAWAWNETPTNLQEAGHDAVMNKQVKEGASTWICGFSMLTSGEGSEDQAYDYINAFLEDQTAKYLVSEWGYAASTTTGMAQFTEEELTDAGYADIAGFFEATLFQSAMDPQIRERMIAEFAKIKAGF
ncbi:MAG: polyamine ABC transporter substrate-binding protein [Rhizobiales bacterium]|nr:polyamine ABC transporter substrate-binding protein [Hyphomicrobiales bacterium]